MGITRIHAVVLLMIVVGGVVGVSSVVSTGSSGELLTIGETEQQQSIATEGTTVEKTNATDGAFEVRTTLNNTDTTSVAKSVELVVEDDDGSSFTADERTVNLSAGETRTITFSAPSDALTPGTYNYTLGDDTGTLSAGTVSLDGPAFDVSSVRAEPVVRGETGEVTVTVHNRGDLTGMQDVDLLLDRNQDGTYDADEHFPARELLVQPRDDAGTTFFVGTDELEPGTYAYRVEAREKTQEGTLVVQEPATIRIEESTMTTDAVRGERFNGSVTLVNEGDVRGNGTVSLDGPNAAFEWNRSVTLDGNESTTLGFDAGTRNLTRGDYQLNLSVSNGSDSVSNDAVENSGSVFNDSVAETLRVRESRFVMDEMSGPIRADVDDDIHFTARIRNTGDAAANRTIGLRIGLDGEDVPETVVENRSVELTPGERTTIDLTIGADDRERFDDRDLLGTHIYEIYSLDDSEIYGGEISQTDTVVVQRYSTGSSSSESPSQNDDPASVSRDVISQEKYGYYYDELSGGTQRLIDELYQRQPFADGLAVTEVQTREQIARWEFGLDVERNDNFSFTSIEVETQREIEAEFGEQFESDESDRLDSWDELAQERFGSDYEKLDDGQQETIQELYRDQFLS